MPEEIIYFIIRLAGLCLAGFMVWIVVVQIFLPLFNRTPVFPMLNRRGGVLTDIQEFQRKQLEDELEQKKQEVEIAKLETEIEDKRHEIEIVRAKGSGDNK